MVLAETPGAVPDWWEAGQLLLTAGLGIGLVRLHERQTAGLPVQQERRLHDGN